MEPNSLNLPFGLDPLDLATILAGVAAFMVLLAIWAATTVRDPMRERIKALQERRAQLRAGLAAPRRRSALISKADATATMSQILNKLKILQDEQTKQAAERLSQAGWRAKESVVIYQFARLVAPILGGIIALILLYGVGVMADKSTNMKLMVLIGAVLAGYKLPDLLVTNAVQKRSEAIRLALPDALDLLVICAEAGLTLDAAFSRVSRELGMAYPELADEFSLTSIELGFLQERRQALENLSKRVDLQPMRGVVTTLIQTEKYGTPLASSLRVLSAEFRNERMMRAEEKAARLPAVMTVPLILFILPTLFVVIMGPAACSISDSLAK
ncbi:type II secretion system F family protein [Pedomonas mirosovicensis]|uniref:type II secretion system F family protein n=1 Tax=Pedomonas mirosovicensis TaxID=2908641 RepID=UPI0021699380|nr:type II secretion system F family protein [Pedomonas mirosovicensis]MCH8685440.1 type II secretion system F family protein [Pedomonas mirosovicensis]